MIYCKCGCEFPNSRWDSVAICPQCGRTYLNDAPDLFHPKSLDESWMCVNCGTMNDRVRPDGLPCDVCKKCGAPRWDEDDPQRQQEVMQQYRRPPHSAAAGSPDVPEQRETPPRAVAAKAPAIHATPEARQPAADPQAPTDSFAAKPDPVAAPAAIPSDAFFLPGPPKLRWRLLKVLGIVLIVLECLGIFGGIMTGSPIPLPDGLRVDEYIATLVGYFLLAIVGVILILIARYKSKTRVMPATTITDHAPSPRDPINAPAPRQTPEDIPAPADSFAASSDAVAAPAEIPLGAFAPPPKSKLPWHILRVLGGLIAVPGGIALVDALLDPPHGEFVVQDLVLYFSVTIIGAILISVANSKLNK